MGPRLLALITMMRAEAGRGDENFRRHIAAGHLDVYRADLAHLDDSMPIIRERVIG